ncbi:MAG: putative bifunctional diguanylate cyclase/phosphodiesterase [Rhodospirillaceae bacterium]
MSDVQTILLIEDNPGDARLIREMLAEGEPAFRLEAVDRLARGLEFLKTGAASLVLLDLSLPDSFGIDTFMRVYEHAPKVPIIVLTGNDDRTVALSAVKTGAQDYLVKGRLDRELLFRSIQYSIERKRYQEQIERQANYDALTGLPNRSLLHERLRHAMAVHRHERYIAVVFLDLDHFKFVNDGLGHNTGDVLIREIAARLKSAVREGDTVARLGGDEFILVLGDQPGDGAVQLAMQRVLDAVGQPVTLDGQEFSVTCSAGICLYPRDGGDVETLLRNADAAMYRAKAGGRNNFQFYKAEMNHNANERLSMEHNLRRALDRLEFELHYQPRIDLQRRRMVGAEALVRWRHPTAGLIYPDRFIPIAEETGLIVPLGEWVMHTACAQTRAWHIAGYDPIGVSVNLSLRQFKQHSLVRSVQRILTDTGLVASHLEMELTESLVMQDAEGAITTLKALRELGVHVAVDDFGTGYSSLSYLKRLPIAALKIDQAFVRDISDGQGDRGVLAQAIIALGHNLRLRVVAEGVETQEQVSFLEQHGCDEVQGMYFGRPVPAAEFEALLLPDEVSTVAAR